VRHEDALTAMEKRLNKLCQRYVDIQTSSTGRKHDFTAPRLSSSLEATKVDSQQKEMSDLEVVASLNRLQDELDVLDKKILKHTKETRLLSDTQLDDMRIRIEDLLELATDALRKLQRKPRDLSEEDESTTESPGYHSRRNREGDHDESSPQPHSITIADSSEDDSGDVTSSVPTIAMKRSFNSSSGDINVNSSSPKAIKRSPRHSLSSPASRLGNPRENESLTKTYERLFSNPHNRLENIQSIPAVSYSCLAIASGGRSRVDKMVYSDEDLNWVLNGELFESHEDPVYCVSWSRDTVDGHCVFATCGKNYVSIYSARYGEARDDEKRMVPIQSYIDSSSSERYYACVFAGRHHPNTQSGGSPQFLCVGGVHRRIVVLNTAEMKAEYVLTGHGDDILDIQVCPSNEWVIASAAADGSVRLWSLENGSPLAILAGRLGHRDAVTSIAWHQGGAWLVSGGMDASIKLWDVSAHTRDEAQRDDVASLAALVAAPSASIKSFHTNCVDCVLVFGGAVVSKSVGSVIEMWYPPTFSEKEKNSEADMATQKPVHVRSFLYENGHLWYVRCAIDPSGRWLVVGNVKGVLTLWDTSSEDLGPKATLQLEDEVVIRSVAFSPCSRMLLCTTDCGSIHKLDLTTSR